MLHCNIRQAEAAAIRQDRLLGRDRNVEACGDEEMNGSEPVEGVIRNLWVDRAGPYRDHLLRLDAESRRNRFGGAVSDDFIINYIELSLGLDAMLHGFFVDGTL